MRNRSTIASGLTGAFVAALLVFRTALGSPQPDTADSIDREPLQLHSSLRSRERIVANTHTAKNVILFIGDGMGITTVTAARIFDGQSRGESGEENALAFEGFPNLALIKTYSTNQQVSDSAGTASAMHTGVKTRAGVISVGPDAERRSCEGALAHPLKTLGEVAEEKGKSTGFVTTARITHATPATMYAHSPERDWESDEFIPDSALQAGCRDIAYQLAHFSAGDGIDVVFGGGRSEFFGAKRGGRRRNADDDLVAVWKKGAANRRYITTAAGLDLLRPREQVLGIFADSHLTYLADRPAASSEPQLAQMTAKAIDLLEARGTGYYLMVEGGRIDHAHHDGMAGYALLETQEFSRAVKVALDKVDLSETLILVTADHSHVFTMGGYATRGNPILGLVFENDEHGRPMREPKIADDGQPFTVLAYANGPGGITKRPRPAPDTGLDAVQQAAVPLSYRDIDGSVTQEETHGGEDVPLYAIGPWSHLVGGVLEQNAIFHIITYAFGWRDDATE